MKKKKKVYWAAPLFTFAERAWNTEMTEILEESGYQVFLPQRETTKPSDSGIFNEDTSGIELADIVVAVMDGADPDSGTSWEVGYAYALNIPIILLRTDFRRGGEGKHPVNIMLAMSTKHRICKGMAEVLRTLKKV